MFVMISKKKSWVRTKETNVFYVVGRVKFCEGFLVLFWRKMDGDKIESGIEELESGSRCSRVC